MSTGTAAATSSCCPGPLLSAAKGAAPGGHGGGRKWPIVLAGIVLGNRQMQPHTTSLPMLIAHWQLDGLIENSSEEVT